MSAFENFNKVISELKLDNQFKNFDCKSPNLLCTNNSFLFIYAEQIPAFITICLNKQTEKTCQYLHINSTPIGVYKKSIISPNGNYIIIVCDKSLTLVELPSIWGKFGLYENGKQKIACKSFQINLNKNLHINDALWHLGDEQSNANETIVCLTNDNCVRFFRTSNPSLQYKEFHLNASYSEPLSKDLNFKASRSLSLDIGSKLKYCGKFGYPIFVLKSNGQVECVIEYEKDKKFEYLGALELVPYCMDYEENQVISFICLRNSPNTLAILLTNGNVYHCVFMTNIKSNNYESENNFKEYLGSDSNGDAILFVYENIKLDENLANLDIQIVRDPLMNNQYFLYHTSGVHCINLPWLDDLQTIYQKDKSLNEFDEQKLCEVTQIVCTRPFLDRDIMLFIIGAAVFYNFAELEHKMICLTNEPEFIFVNINLKNLGNWNFKLKENDAGESQKEDLFTNYIISILKQNSHMPNLNTKIDNVESDHLKLFANNAFNLIQKEYLEKQKNVIIEFNKKCKLLKNQETLQFQIMNDIQTKLQDLEKRKKSIGENLNRISDQEQHLKNRLEGILIGLLKRTNAPKNDAIASMNQELKAIDFHLKDSHTKINESKKILDKTETFKLENAQFKMKDDEIHQIKAFLKNQSEKIRDLVQKVELIGQAIKR